MRLFHEHDPNHRRRPDTGRLSPFGTVGGPQSNSVLIAVPRAPRPSPGKRGEGVLCASDPPMLRVREIG
jgi:hypothetical protein